MFLTSSPAASDEADSVTAKRIFISRQPNPQVLNGRLLNMRVREYSNQTSARVYMCQDGYSAR